MPKVVMLIGMPCTGKSTCVAKSIWSDVVVLSSDSYIEAKAAELGLSYNDVFKDHVKDATNALNADLKFAIANDYSVIWDQTNLNKKTRASRLARFPAHYGIEYWIFPLVEPVVLYQRMLDKRPEKVIPMFVLNQMYETAQMPDAEELIGKGYQTIQSRD